MGWAFLPAADLSGRLDLLKAGPQARQPAPPARLGIIPND
jgi:hypothetical protein